MTVFTHIFACILGVFFMAGAFFATGIRGALFRRGPYHPISQAGRVIIFLAGAAVFIDSLEWLLGRYAALGVWWRLAVPFTAVGILVVMLNSKLVRAYMARTVTSKPTVAIKFSNGLPSALAAARIAFFVIVAAMLVFGIAPISGSTAKAGIIGCVLALFALAFVYVALEHHYINTGRASEIKFPAQTPEPKR